MHVFLSHGPILSFRYLPMFCTCVSLLSRGVFTDVSAIGQAELAADLLRARNPSGEAELPVNRELFRRENNSLANSMGNRAEPDIWAAKLVSRSLRIACLIEAAASTVSSMARLSIDRSLSDRGGCEHSLSGSQSLC